MPSLCAEKGDAFAQDLARLEWAIVSVIHAADPPPLTLAALATLAPHEFARQRLVARPALQLLQLRYPVNAYYYDFWHDRAPAISEPAPSSVLVQRSGQTVYRRELPSAAAALLASLISGTPVASALAADGGADPDAIGEWFREWVGSGLFSGLAPAD
ncbi:MAG TPA: hypothetical protein VF331_08120 [Polyangiales bacterium]